MIVWNYSNLWNFSKPHVEDFYVAWRKVIRRLWKLPNLTHCNLLHTINNSLPINIILEKRCAKFIWSSLNSNNKIINSISRTAICNPFSDMGDNYRYITAKYSIPIIAWTRPLPHLLKYFTSYIESYIVDEAYGFMIRELCLHRDRRDFILNANELSTLIDYLCTV